MKPRRVCAVSFSPTGKSEELARLLSAELAAFTGAAQSFFSLNLPRERAGVLRFARDDLVVAVSPVYAGRLPNKLAPDFARVLRGDGTPVLAVCAFGNRSPGDALREWLLLLEAGGFVPLGAMAAACRHAFTDDVGRGRPDAQDRVELLEQLDDAILTTRAEYELYSLTLMAKDILDGAIARKVSVGAHYVEE